MSEFLEALFTEPEQFVEVDRSEFLSLLTRMETHYMHLFDEAMEGLRSVASMRRTIFQAEEDNLIVKCKVGTDGSAQVRTKVKEPIGFLK